MKYLGNVLVKIALLPIALILFIPAYVLFILDPEARRFHYKVVR